MEEIKKGLRRFLGEWHRDLAPTTKAMRDFIDRETPKAIMQAPARMIDSVEEMIASYRKKDIDKTPGTSAHLPVVFFALARDALPGLEWVARSQGEGRMVVLPDDPKERVFELRQHSGEVRAQVVFMAADDPTARSLAIQFAMFLEGFGRRRFAVPYQFAGVEFDYPCMVETPDIFTNHTPGEAENLVVLAQDVTLRFTIPFLRGPRAGEPNDGKGTPGDANDPSGFPITGAIEFTRIGDGEAVELSLNPEGEVIETPVGP